jgi:uncharacterized membrane protein (DUF485 family)
VCNVAEFEILPAWPVRIALMHPAWNVAGGTGGSGRRGDWEREGMDDQLASRIRNNPAFAELESSRTRFAWTSAILMLVIYYGFVLLVAFAPGLMGMNVGGQITLGFPLGLGVILSAIILTGIYVWRANGEFDSLTRKIVESAR